MAVPFICPRCQRPGRLPDGFKGDRVRCPACRTAFALPRESRTIPPVPAPQNSGPRPAPPPVRTAAERSGPPVVVIALSAGAAALVIMAGAVFALLSWSAGKKEKDQATVVAQAGAGVADLPAARPVQPARFPAAAPSADRIAQPRELSILRPPAAPAGRADPPGAQAPVDAVPPERNPRNAPAAPPEKDPAPALSPAETVRRIKEATVYLRVRAGQTGGSGSGFVVRVEGRSVLVATNHHVVFPHIEESDDADDPRFANVKSTIIATFRSGLGRGVEQSYPATIIASEREGNRDLAILRVEGVDDPPSPITWSDRTDLIETMPVLIYGFPFGNIDKMLNQAVASNPAITINRGSVSSLRRDEFKRVSYIQVDGSLNPGNSGGPVVDEKGRLVGVAVAGIANTTIGFAIPAAELTRMLDGRIGRLSMALVNEQAGTASLRAQAKVVDPLSRIRSVELLYAPDDNQNRNLKPYDDGTWPPLVTTTKANLALNGAIASGTFEAATRALAGRRLTLQSAYRDRDGNVVYGAPVPFVVPDRPTELAAVGVALEPRQGKAADTLSFALFKTLLDPTRHCKMKREPAALTIDLPAGVHLLAPDLDQANAPMTLTDVDGDFIIRVKVGGHMLPGSEPAKLRGRPLPMTFHGAGILFWQNKNNYVRVERTAGNEPGKPALKTELLLEVVKNGKPAVFQTTGVPDGPLYVGLLRLNGALQCMYGPDGRRWRLFQKLATAFPSAMQVGLCASNASKEPLSARFEDFVLVTDKKKVVEAEQP